MHENQEPVLAISRSLLLRRRSPLLAAVAIGAMGILYLFVVRVVRGASGPDDLVWIEAGVALAVGMVTAILGALRINRLGIFVEGISPPFKPWGDLLQEPLIVPWREVERISIEPSEGRVDEPLARIVTITFASGVEARFTGQLVADRFRSESAAQKFMGLLELAAKSVPREPFQTGLADPHVRSLLKRTLPGVNGYARTRTSKAGVLVGGILTIGLVILILVAPSGSRDGLISLLGLALLLRVGSTLSPGLFPKSKGTNRLI